MNNAIKLEKCLHEKQLSGLLKSFWQTNWVINFSSWTLSKVEVSVLKKGLNFAMTPADVQTTKIIIPLTTLCETS